MRTIAHKIEEVLAGTYTDGEIKALTRIVATELLGFSQTTAIVTIAALLDKGLIVKVGNGNKTKYKIV